MALMKCPECKKKISDQAQSCPNCGRPLSDADRQPKTISLSSIIIIILFLIFVIGMFFSRDEDEANTVDASKNPHINQQEQPSGTGGNSSSKEDYDSRIASFALIPYTSDQYPETVAEFGSRLEEIEQYRRRAAEMVLDSGSCDIVYSVELSTDSTLNNLEFFTDCANEHRVYLTEYEIDINAEVLTQEDKAWTEVDAREACRKGIKERSLLPSEVEFHTLLGTRFYHAPLSHNVILEMNFDAQNIFGAKIPYTATCHFEPGKVGAIDIKIRN